VWRCDHDEGGVLVVHEAALVAELLTDLEKAWSARLVECGEMAAMFLSISQDVLVDPQAHFRKKLEQMRLLVVDVEVVASSLVLGHHGADLRERVELVLCCLLTPLFAGGWWLFGSRKDCCLL